MKLGMRQGYLAWALGLSLTAAAVAAPVPAAAQERVYKPMPLMGAGYRDKERGPNRWWVRGFASGDLALHLALYRGALLMKVQGYSHFMIVDSALVAGGWMSMTSAAFTIIGTNTPGTPIPCEAKGRWVRNCRLINVDETIAVSGSSVFRTAAQIEEDLNEAREHLAESRLRRR